jgi:hypothetical protein
MMLTGGPTDLEKTLYQSHFDNHKSHMTGIEPGLRGERPMTNRLSYVTA